MIQGRDFAQRIFVSDLCLPEISGGYNGDPLSTHATGLLLHPSIDEMVNEAVVIQGHEIRFATVDLGAKASEIRRQFLQVVGLSDETEMEINHHLD